MKTAQKLFKCLTIQEFSLKAQWLKTSLYIQEYKGTEGRGVVFLCVNNMSRDSIERGIPKCAIYRPECLLCFGTNGSK